MNRLLRVATTLWLTATCLYAGGPSFCQEPGPIPMQSPSTDFSLKLFSEQTKGNTENVLVSPFSAYFALCMTLNGAGGKTREQMARVLGTSGGTVDRLNEHNAEVMKALSANDKVQLEIANAIYSDESTPFKKDFIDLCRRSYSADAHSENFASPAVVTKINAWCSQKTHGKIPEILKKLTPREKMVLLNAIYFKGSWQNQFQKSLTQDDQFTTLSGDKCPIKMMHQRGKSMYYRGSNFHSVSLPYAGERQRMYIFLPNPGVDMATFGGQFTRESWSSWMQSYHTADVNLALPKFKIEYSTELKDTLAAMGMGDAFHQGADFSNLIRPPAIAWISRVLQKTYMDVNEEGTEAAAVTAVVMAAHRAVARREPVVEFRVDRPFVLALVDEPTNEILFLGSIVKP